MNSILAKTTPILSPHELHHFADQFFTDAHMNNNFFGAALVMVKDGEIALSGGYGYVDLNNNTPLILIRLCSLWTMRGSTMFRGNKKPLSNHT